MAVIPGKDTSFFNLPMSIQRLNPTPVDTTYAWTSLAEAQDYASTDPTAYVGQMLVVVDQSGQTVTPYLIGLDGTLTEFAGGAIESVDVLPGTSDTSLKEGSIVYLNTGEQKGMYYLTSDSTGATKSWQKLASTSDLAGLGGGDMLKSEYATSSRPGAVDAAELAYSTSGRLNILNANGTSVGNFNGGANVNISASTLGALTSVPIANATHVGGIKSSTAQDSASVTADGFLSIGDISASKVKGSVASAQEASRVTSTLTFLNATGSTIATFNGANAVEISASDLGALTSVPNATASNVGLMKPGTGMAVDANGILTPDAANFPKASATNFGVVKVGSGINVDTNGVISTTPYSLPAASTTIRGGVKVDGTSILVGGTGNDILSVGAVNGANVTGIVPNAAHASIAANYSISGGGSASIETALAGKVDTANIANAIAPLKGAKNGIAPLDETGHVASQYLPSYIDDIIEGYYINTTTFLVGGASEEAGGTPVDPETGKIYVDITDPEAPVDYRWTGTTFISIIDPIDYATPEQAEAGTDNTVVMTPLRTHQAIAAANINVRKLFVQEGDTFILNCGTSVL